MAVVEGLWYFSTPTREPALKPTLTPPRELGPPPNTHWLELNPRPRSRWDPLTFLRISSWPREWRSARPRAEPPQNSPTHHPYAHTRMNSRRHGDELCGWTLHPIRAGRAGNALRAPNPLRDSGADVPAQPTGIATSAVSPTHTHQCNLI